MAATSVGGSPTSAQARRPPAPGAGSPAPARWHAACTWGRARRARAVPPRGERRRQRKLGPEAAPDTAPPADGTGPGRALREPSEPGNPPYRGVDGSLILSADQRFSDALRPPRAP